MKNQNMKSAKRSINTNGISHYPAECKKCKWSGFGAQWNLAKFIKGNHGTPEELELSYINHIRHDLNSAKRADIDLTCMSCINCEFLLFFVR